MSLIKREDLIEHLNLCLSESDGGTPITDAVITTIRCAVEQMPEVDAAPVVHGRWIKKHHSTVYDGFMKISGDYPTCSLCGFAEMGLSQRTNFCPNCGARMDLEDEA